MIQGAVRDLKSLIGEFSHFSRLPAIQPERTDPNTGEKTGPMYLELVSKTRPKVTGWAWAQPIRATLVE